MYISYPRLLAAGTPLVCALLLSGCERAGSVDAVVAPPEVGIASVVTRPVRLADEFNGRVEAIQSVDIRPRVSGYIDRIAFAEGAEVEAGDLLFVIDPRPYRDALKSAQARLESARAAARLAQSRYLRAQKLIGARAISREEFDASQASLDQTTADLHAGEAAVATASLNLDFTEVRAPVAGRASRAMLTRGNLAQADQTLLTTVVSQDAMYVYFDCDEQSYLRYGVGAKGSDTELRVALADEDNFPREGKVDFIDNRLDPTTGTIRARAIVRNDDRKLTPGLFARVRFQSGAPVETRLIDEKAVLTDQDHRYVYVIGKGNKAIRKDIVIGRDVDGMRIVQSGLAGNDRVIVSGVQKVYFSGMPVKPEPAANARKLDAALIAASTQ
jgi:multidrug efflux system membrane fusion protein